jgi:hypothetical protein
LHKNITHQEQTSAHILEVSYRFPAHPLVNVQQCTLPAVKPRVLNYPIPQILLGSLEIGEHCFLISGRFFVKSHCLRFSVE